MVYWVIGRYFAFKFDGGGLDGPYGWGKKNLNTQESWMTDELRALSLGRAKDGMMRRGLLFSDDRTFPVYQHCILLLMACHTLSEFLI